MKAQFTINDSMYEADLDQPIDISIPLKEGASNPNCYWADPVQTETVVSGTFVGSVREGGKVNYQKLIVTPHGNGTHTECYGHISPDGATINQCLDRFHFLAELISVSPQAKSNGDYTISESMLKNKIVHPAIQALIVRTLPNDPSKMVRQYSGTNPPYVEPEALDFLVANGIRHLLVDLPSLDKERDGGKLLAHRSFWNYPQATRTYATITELIYAGPSVHDGLYLLNLQIASLELDASPSKPVLYKLTEVL